MSEAPKFIWVQCVLQQYRLANMVLQPHKITLHAANRGEGIVVFIFFAVFYYLALTGALWATMPHHHLQVREAFLLSLTPQWTASTTF